MEPSQFISALPDLVDPQKILRELCAHIQDYGGRSADYAYVEDGARQPGWATHDADLREAYFSQDLHFDDPDFQRHRRLPVARAYQLSEGHPSLDQDHPITSIFEEIRSRDLSAIVFVPDDTAPGRVDMAAINIFADVPHASYARWRVSEGEILASLAAAVHRRIRMIRMQTPFAASPLTVRQAEMLTDLSVGLRPCQIAGKRQISERTVEFHIGKARERLNARTREEAIAVAASNGWLRGEDITEPGSVSRN
ncbi:MAG: helix-turn-helix transcriptional regulator [Pseudomonadota bacterium]